MFLLRFFYEYCLGSITGCGSTAAAKAHIGLARGFLFSKTFFNIDKHAIRKIYRLKVRGTYVQK